MLQFDFPNWIDPVIFSAGPIQLTWYALAYMAGLVAGWHLIRRRVVADQFGLSAEDIDDFVIYALLGVILGGRIGTFVFGWGAGEGLGEQLRLLFWPVQYDADGSWTLALSGMSFHGGFLGVVLATVLFWYRKKRAFSLWGFADYLALVAPIGLFFGRIANFINRELYGRLAGEGAWFRVSFSPENNPMPGHDYFQTRLNICLDGAQAPANLCREYFDLVAYRHPSQLYEAAGEGVLLFAIAVFLYCQPAIRNCAGFVTGTFIAGYGLIRTLVEFVRSYDDGVGLNALGLSRSQELSLPMIALGLALMIWAWRARERERAA